MTADPSGCRKDSMVTRGSWCVAACRVGARESSATTIRLRRGDGNDVAGASSAGVGVGHRRLGRRHGLRHVRQLRRCLAVRRITSLASYRSCSAVPPARGRPCGRCPQRVSAATVSRFLKRLGLNRLSALEPAEPPRHYRRDRPGELIHIDIKGSASSTR
jgi:hypothetical protein